MLAWATGESMRAGMAVIAGSRCRCAARRWSECRRSPVLDSQHISTPVARLERALEPPGQLFDTTLKWLRRSWPDRLYQVIRRPARGPARLGAVASPSGE